MPNNQVIKLYLHGRNGEYKFLIWSSATMMPVPTLRTDTKYSLEDYQDDQIIYSCEPESAEFVMTRLVELMQSSAFSQPKPHQLIGPHNPPWQFRGIKLPGLPAIEVGARPKEIDRESTWIPLIDAQGEYRERDEVIRELEELNARILSAEPTLPKGMESITPLTEEQCKTIVIPLPFGQKPSPTAALTKEEDRAEDDLVFKNCEDWTERLKAKHYLQLRALGMSVERAEAIIRKTGAKG